MSLFSFAVWQSLLAVQVVPPKAPEAAPLPEAGTVSAILVRAAERPTALLTDEMLGAREIVVKPLGPQLAGIRGVAGATVLGDGKIVLILDVAALIRARVRGPEPVPVTPLKVLAALAVIWTGRAESNELSATPSAQVSTS